MNLNQTVEWLKKETNRIEAEKAPQAQINAYNILAWLCELMRYRLFLSEFTREIELTEQKSKEDLLNYAIISPDVHISFSFLHRVALLLQQGGSFYAH